MGVIKIEQGNEFKIITKFIEKNDVFLNQYHIAAAHVEEIVKSNNIESQADEHLNNIIAFCGERGQGKSSAMHSFTEALIAKNNEINFGIRTKETNFLKLNTIDPSTFENIHNVVEVVVAKMFNKIKEVNEGGEITNFTKIINMFQKVYECLSLIRNPKKLEELEYDYEGSIQKVSHIGDSTKLKEHMCELVKLYIEIVGKPNKPDFLIIPIDDLDINIELAYKMAEQIRKYLLIPNVIIIMAVKIEQLKYCVELQYRKELDMLIKADNRLNKQELINMASKYIEKLIPDGRKINLPELKILASNNNDVTEIEYTFKQKVDNDEGNSVNLLEKYKGFGVEKTILGYIYEKTGLIFVKPENRVHPLMPNTLRELVNLISVLGKMDINKSLNNIIMFENYLLNTWIPSNLDDGYIRIVRSFYFEHDLIKHSLLCSMLLNILETYTNYTLEKKHENEFDDLKEQFAEKNLSDYSLGDVLTLLNFIEKRFHDSEIRSFVFVVRTLYSITMRKMVMEDRQDKEEKKNIYKFINGDLWGYHVIKKKPKRLIPRNNKPSYIYSEKKTIEVMRLNADLGEHRAVFEYDVAKVFGYDLSDTNYLSVRNLTEKQVSLISDVLFFSNFDEYGIFLSDNSTYRKRAQFSIDNLLISSVDLDNLNSKWGFQPDLRINESIRLIKERINVDLITEILSNVELSEYVWNYCKVKKDISFKANDQEHIINFVQNIERSINSSYLDYLNFEGHHKIFRCEDGYNWAANFHRIAFDAIIREGHDKRERDILKSDFEKIGVIGRVCIPYTLINKILNINKLLDESKLKLDQSILNRINKLKVECQELHGNYPKENIKHSTKDEYNSIYKHIQNTINNRRE